MMSTEVQEKLSEFARELEHGQQKYLPELAPLSLSQVACQARFDALHGIPDPTALEESLVRDEIEGRYL